MENVFTGLSAVFVLVVLWVALGRRWLAVASFVGLVTHAYSWSSAYFWITFAGTLALQGFFTVILVRVGPLAAVTAFYVSGLFVLFPVTVESSRWYAGAGVSAPLVLGAMAAFGVANGVRSGPSASLGAASP